MRGFPSFFVTVNHRERYAELDDSYTPAAIFRLICFPANNRPGASEQDLANILRTYNQPTDPSHIYDSVYTCFKQNSVGWVSWCGGPYTCEPITGWPQARCK